MASPAIRLQVSPTSEHVPFRAAVFARTVLLVPVIGSILILVVWSIWDRLTRGPEPLRQKIQNTLAVSAEWNNIRRGSPFQLQIQNAKFRDAEHGSFLLSSRTIDFRAFQGKNEVTVHSATINRNQLGHIIRLVHDRLSQQPWLFDHEWCFDMPTFRLSDPHFESHHGDAAIQISTCDGRPTARLQVTLAGQSDQQSILATLKRVERNGTMTSEIDLDATQYPLPRAFFCSGRPWEAALQASSAFQGNGWIDVADGIWEMDFVGTLGPIDLAPLGRLAYQESITGSANIRIVQALFRNDELRQLDCFVTSDQGTVTGRALEAMAKKLGLRMGSAIDRTGNWRDRTYHYDQFALRLTARSNQWTVSSVEVDSSAIMKAGKTTLLHIADRVENGNAASLERLFSSSRRQSQSLESVDTP